MKIDKDDLKKNRFWIGLGGFVLLWFICFVTLRVSASSARNAEKTKFDTASKAVGEYFTAGPDKKPNVKAFNPAKRPKNDSFLPPWEKYGEKFRDQKDEAWKQAWEVQKDLLVFGTDGLNDRWKKSNSFEEWLAGFENPSRELSSELNLYRGAPRSLYLKQFADLEPRLLRDGAPQDDGLLFPAEYRGARAGYELIMAPATAGSGEQTGNEGRSSAGQPGYGGHSQRSIIGFWRNGQPTAEELFLAQEDFSVKVELLRCLRKALDGAARMEEGPSGFWHETLALAEPPAKDNARRVFHNANWELTLLFETEGNKTFIAADSVIRNVNVSRRTLLVSNPTTKGALEFVLRQGGNEKKLQLKGERLAWGKEAKFGDRFTCDVIDPSRPFTVEQVFDWSTSPVRRVDDVRIPALSHRLAAVPLKPHPGFKAPEQASEEQPSGGKDERQQGAVPPGAVPPTGTATGGGGDAPAAKRNATETNGLAVNRYLAVTDQARALPFGLVVVVDEANVDDVVAALCNSPLRVQISQIDYQRVRNVKSLANQPAQPREGDTGRPVPPGTTGYGQVQTDDGDPNLVELTVYGIATLYQRYTPAKKEEAK
jgi:hypothetical protein